MATRAASVRRAVARWLIIGIKVALVAAPVTYLVTTEQLTLGDLAAGADRPVLLAVSVALLAVGLSLSFVRQWLVLRACGVPVRFWRGFKGCWIGVCAGQLTLGGIVTDGVKALYFGAGSTEPGAAVTAVLADRILALVSLLFLWMLPVVVAWPSYADHTLLAPLHRAIALGFILFAFGGLLMVVSVRRSLPRATWPAIAGGGGYLAGALTLGHMFVWEAVAAAVVFALLGYAVQRFNWPRQALAARVPEVVHMAAAAAVRLLANLPVLVLATAISIVSQAIVLLSLHGMLEALSGTAEQNLLLTLLAAPPAVLSNMAPLPFGGLGIGEVLFQRLLILYGGIESAIDFPPGAAAYLLLRLWTTVLALGALPLYLSAVRSIGLKRGGY